MTVSARWPDREKRDAEILRRNNARQSARKISTEMGIARNTVTRTLIANDVDLSVTGKQSRLGVRRELPMTGPELVEAYVKNNATIKGLARRCHVSPYTIRTRLTDEGVEIRPPGLKEALPERAILTEYRQGMTLKSLGEKYKVSPDTIRSLLTRHNVTIRRRWA